MSVELDIWLIAHVSKIELSPTIRLGRLEAASVLCASISTAIPKKEWEGGGGVGGNRMKYWLELLQLRPTLLCVEVKSNRERRRKAC